MLDIDVDCVEFMVHGRVAWSMTCSPPFYIGRARAQTTSRLLGRAGATSHRFALHYRHSSLVALVPSSTKHIARSVLNPEYYFIGSPHLTNMIDVVVQRPRDGCLYEIRQKGQKDPCYVVVPNPKVCYLFLSSFFYQFLIVYFVLLRCLLRYNNCASR